MTAETLCAVCDRRPVADQAYACSGCTGRAAGHLAAIIELASDARLVAAGLVRRGRGGAGGKPGSRPPLNDGATDVVDAVQNALTTLAREIADVRGLRIDWAGRTLVDPLIGACSWLYGSLEWARHAVDDQGQPYAVHAFAEIDACAGRLRGLVNGPAEQKYLGPCGATQRELPAEDGCPVNCACHNGPHYACDEPGGCGSAGCGQPVIVDTEPCEGDVFGHPDAETGRCKTCGAKWPADQRRAWLNGEVRMRAFRAAQIAEAYGVRANTIRVWAARGQLLAHGHDRDDRPLYNVGDVLDLAAADAARRAGEQAKRARRAAAHDAAEVR